MRSNSDSTRSPHCSPVAVANVIAAVGVAHAQDVCLAVRNGHTAPVLARATAIR
jgi:hypothetical protein